MPHWLLKSAAQRVISQLPSSHRWNELFQNRITRSLELTPSRFETRLQYCGRHLRHLREHGGPASRDFTVVDIGTGWFPVVPVGLFLCGAGTIYTFDISPLLKMDRVVRMLEMFVRYGAAGRLDAFVPGVIPERLERIKAALSEHPELPVEELLRKLDIHAFTREAQNTGLASGSVDLFTSTGVLEYIPRPVLKEILAECLRTGKPAAVQSHYLNLADQYSYFDRSITPFNFLKFSEGTWKYLNSPLTWQNRLRISDYRELFHESGYVVLAEENTSGSIDELQRVRLAPEFGSHRKEDLLVLFSWLVAAPKTAHHSRTI